ncbi:hypothetical protein TSUD_295350 [Trifolium subterraneum]|uniref:F-box domain-containing protein n=1 Tax=Trifolium subterraneum TaxID=3900 RepID=A0A2Z6NVM6_TRISU|nr:hypothetical protein TSUD_295350 [Trifolium subterraneum]
MAPFQFWLELPLEMRRNILERLATEDLVTASQVCLGWKKICIMIMVEEHKKEMDELQQKIEELEEKHEEMYRTLIRLSAKKEKNEF